VFAANCSVTVTNTVGQLLIQNPNTPNTAWPQSRSFTGAVGTPGAGKTDYEYPLGTIDLGSAEQDGDVITFNFKTFLCPSKPANTTFFFGLASAHPPASTLAGVFVTASPPYYNVPARAP